MQNENENINKHINNIKTKYNIAIVLILLLIITYIYWDKYVIHPYLKYSCGVSDISNNHYLSYLIENIGLYVKDIHINQCQWHYKNIPTCIAGGMPYDTVPVDLFCAPTILVDLNIADNSAKNHAIKNQIGEWYHQIKVLKLYVNLLENNSGASNNSITPTSNSGTTNSGTTNIGTTNIGTITNSGASNSGTTNIGTTNSYVNLTQEDINFKILMNSEKYKYGCIRFQTFVSNMCSIL